MATANSTITVKPFDGSNFGNWEFRVKLLLEHHDVLNVISEDPPTGDAEAAWKKKDLRARNLIVMCLCDNVLEMVKSKSTAKAMMETLSKTYSKSGLSNQIQLQTKLRNMRYTGNDSLNNFIIEFEKTITELKSCGGSISDMEIITQLLSSMPEVYQTVTTAIDIYFCQNQDEVTLDL